MELKCQNQPEIIFFQMKFFSLGSPFLTKTFSESSVKFFMLQAHYRNVLDISNDALVASERGFQRIKDAIDNLNNLTIL